MVKSPLSGVLCALLLLTISACSKSSSRNDVWDVYDIRHPVPAQSNVPVSAASNPFNQNPYGMVPPTSYPAGAYGDNDDAYVPPRGALGKGYISPDVCQTGDIGIGCN